MTVSETQPVTRNLILASESPRRRELLERAGFAFHTLPSKVSEILDKSLILDEALIQLAEQKAMAVTNSIKMMKIENYLILAADTVVVLNKQVLGKPDNAEQAVEFLGALSGQIHQVKTALCLVDQLSGGVVSHMETSQVHFRILKNAEIQSYVKSGEPLDKAGAYAIQGGAKDFVRRLEGSLDNVIGLPVAIVERILNDHGWQVCRRATSGNSTSNSERS